MKKSARVVVIGGGAVGVSCLWHLVQTGITDCLLIERDELTSGSTWHAAGNIPIYATSWLGMRAGAYARRLYGALGEDVTYHHTGAFWPAHGEDRMDLFRHLTGLATSAGVDLVMITPGEMEALHPTTQPERMSSAAFSIPVRGTSIPPNSLKRSPGKPGRPVQQSSGSPGSRTFQPHVAENGR